MRRFLYTSFLILIVLGLLASAPSVGFAQLDLTPTVETIAPVETATPQPDGSIIHVVQYGQALITIATAYGVPPEELIALNDLDPDDPVLWVGRELIIRLAPTATVTPTATITIRPPTRTATLSPTPVTPTATRTITPTPTATPRALVPDIRKMNIDTRRSLGIASLVISILGLLAVLYFGFRKK
jgi:LysM repeat protein